MKLINKIQLLALLCIAFQSMYASQNAYPAQGNGSEMDIEQAILQIPEYQGYLNFNKLYQGSNDAFDYTKMLNNKDNDNSILFEKTPYKVEFAAKDNLFNSGKTISITVRYVYNGKLWTQSEQWVSKNNSYLTWTNAALAATAVGAGIGAYTILNTKNGDNLEISPAIELTPTLTENKIKINKPDDKTLQIEDKSPGILMQGAQTFGHYTMGGISTGANVGSTIGDKAGIGIGAFTGGAGGAIIGSRVAGPAGLVGGAIVGSGLGALTGSVAGNLAGGLTGGVIGLGAGTVAGTAAVAGNTIIGAAKAGGNAGGALVNIAKEKLNSQTNPDIAAQ